MSKRTFETAVVKLPDVDLLLVAVAPWVFEDACERLTIRCAFERATTQPIVLIGRKPCGCELMHGMAEHMQALSRVAPGQIIWGRVSIDLASKHPTLQPHARPRRRIVVN